jgi:HSP20 family protein
MARTALPTLLTRWDPFSHLDDLRREMNLVFDRTLGRNLPERTGIGQTLTWLPDAEVVEEEKSYVVRMDLPGIDRESIDIGLANNVLTIQGERKTEKERKEENVHVSERAYGRFLRSFTLPQEVDAEKVDAKLHHGVLEIRLTKMAEARSRKITIQT